MQIIEPKDADAKKRWRIAELVQLHDCLTDLATRGFVTAAEHRTIHARLAKEAIPLGLVLPDPPRS